MKRNYANRTEQQDVATYFTGTEVEKTPAYGMKTLFVVGVRPVDEILRTANLPHIYFGANQSFDAVTNEDWIAWETMITAILKAGYWVTLDLDVSDVENLHESCLTEYQKFIPMISIKLPYTGLFNYNTTIKIDDKGFEATNPGVWCHQLHDLMDRSKFTTWDEYKEDNLIK
jgi:hypothetical protein